MALKKAPKPQPIALRIELQNVEPLVWRRALVPNHWSLASLHHYLQWIMGWNESHAHEFEVGATTVAPDWWIEEMSVASKVSNYRDERRVSIAKVASELGVRGEFEYRYDMGDGWTHRIVIEQPAASALIDLPLPRCVAGENACPPDDIGGPPGYELFLQILGDPRHEQHEDMVRWIGGVFDPTGFDLNRINREWRPGRKRR